LDQLQNRDYDRDEQQNVEQAADRVRRRKAKSPEHQQNQN
jgi:hypothetical protein